MGEYRGIMRAFVKVKKGIMTINFSFQGYLFPVGGVRLCWGRGWPRTLNPKQEYMELWQAFP